MANVGVYTTVTDFKTYLGISATTDDSLLRGFCTAASRQLDRWCRGRRFYPRSETRYFDHPDNHTNLLILDDDLLEVTMCMGLAEFHPWMQLTMAWQCKAASWLHSSGNAIR